jgi:hypothetical protein
MSYDAFLSRWLHTPRDDGNARVLILPIDSKPVRGRSNDKIPLFINGTIKQVNNLGVEQFIFKQLITDLFHKIGQLTFSLHFSSSRWIFPKFFKLSKMNSVIE